MQASGDIVNLRARPGEDARIVARLPIGTTLEAEGEGRTQASMPGQRDGWVRVSVVGRPEAHALVGWVREDLVEQRLGDGDELLRRAANATNPEEAQHWRDRAAALDPWNAAVVAERGEPAGPVWIGQCDGSRVWLVARADPRTFRVTAASVGPDEQFLTLEAQERIRSGLATAAWYAGGEVGQSGRFATPFLAPITAMEEDGGDGWSAGASSGSGGPWEVVLGGCWAAERGQIFATGPLEPLVTTPAGGVHLQRAVDVATQSGAVLMGVAARSGPRAGTEVAVLQEAGMPSCTDGDSEVGTGTFYTWVAPDGVRTEPFVVNFTRDVATGTGLASWFSWQGSPVGFILGSDMEAVTTVIRLDEAGHAVIDHIPFRYFGC